MTSVIVIGGGVGGLTAAHELAQRGFTVDVYEARPTWGGKARSQPVAGTGTGGRRDLPGEHGFRFYPRFYKHVVDTMARIPSPLGGHVIDRLQATTESAIALVDTETWYRFYRKRVTKPYDILSALELFFQELDFDSEDVALFAAKILQFFTSSDARRLGEYELMSWWNFLEGDHYSQNFQKQLRAVPHTMVAMDPKKGSARTVGTISMQLILDFASTGVNNDRTMGGPTTEMWFDPWIAQLESLGVKLHAGTGVAKLDVAGGRISGIEISGGGTAQADYYVLALPIDAAIGMITPEMAALDPVLARLAAKNPDDLVSWMCGIQYFLYEDVPLVRGHTFYPDSPWALTTISQPQFWRELGLFRRRYGGGDVGGLISVDVSDWETPGTFVKKPANQCAPDEVAAEIWQQLKAALNGASVDAQTLTDDLRHSWHLDDDLDFSLGLPPVNRGRLLVHPPGSWALRPEAATAIGNLVLASDYVRTYTDLASMEGANEAARHAVNAILASTGSKEVVPTWPLVEPAQFAAWKKLDEKLYAHGHRHLFELLGIRRAAAAADLLRRITSITGLDKLDDWLDEIRPTAIINTLLAKLGVPINESNS
ncbi:MAG TPA: FAD-dependent oxidoreductase [Kofleriaceae bacterium]|nr:FAD-dependent oxidoreductase [Kofleriaceae bacterium]